MAANRTEIPIPGRRARSRQESAVNGPLTRIFIGGVRLKQISNGFSLNWAPIRFEAMSGVDQE
jgi:hypothetical protein